MTPRASVFKALLSAGGRCTVEEGGGSGGGRGGGGVGVGGGRESRQDSQAFSRSCALPPLDSCQLAAGERDNPDLPPWFQRASLHTHRGLISTGDTSIPLHPCASDSPHRSYTANAACIFPEQGGTFNLLGTASERLHSQAQ